MGFICQKCKEDIKNQKENHLITKIRDVTYVKKVMSFQDGEEMTDLKEQEPYKGTEIVEIKRYCNKCFDKVKDKKPEVLEKKRIVFNEYKNKKHRASIKNIPQEIRDKRKDKEYKNKYEPEEKYE